MNKKDNADKIKKLEESIEKSKQIIEKEQEKIKKANAEIKTIQDLEIKGIINEMNIPFGELKEFLKSYNKK